MVFRRQTEGSVVCASCGRLVGVRDEKCFHCGRRNPSLWGFASAIRSLGQDLGFGKLVIGVCLVLYAASLLLNTSAIANRGILGLLSPGEFPVRMLGASGGHPLFTENRWWTVLSAGWLHFGLVHIGFNLYWVSQLAPAIARLYGPGRAVLLYLVSSATGFLLTSMMYLLGLPGPFSGAILTVGASAAIFGWIGALIYYGQRTGSSMLRQQMLGVALPLFIFGLIVPGIDNWAHAGGFIGGYGLAKVLDPLKPERIQHLAWALIGLVLTALSIVASVLHWLSLGGSV